MSLVRAVKGRGEGSGLRTRTAGQKGGGAREEEGRIEDIPYRIEREIDKESARIRWSWVVGGSRTTNGRISSYCMPGQAASRKHGEGNSQAHRRVNGATADVQISKND